MLILMMLFTRKIYFGQNFPKNGHRVSLTQDSQSESRDPVNSIEKSNLFGKSSPHFFVKSQPFSYQLVLNPHTVKTKGKTSMKYSQSLKCEPSLSMLREIKEGFYVGLMLFDIQGVLA